MCRLLLVQSRQPIQPAEYLQPFAAACAASREFQGHGWGITSLEQLGTTRWKTYKNLTPIWEDDLTRFPETRTLLAHARSAFRDEDIVIENNMPFVSGDWSYAFNGELRGVRVRAAGRTGAARIWDLIQRAQTSANLSHEDALNRAISVLERQSEYIRAANIFMTDGVSAIVHSTFNESPDYFTLHRHATDDGSLIVASSEPFQLPASKPGLNETTLSWNPVPNRTTLSWSIA